MDPLLDSFKSPKYFDLKLVLLYNMLPFIKKAKAKEFMLAFEQLLKSQNQKDNCLFKFNSNPIAVGLLLFKVIHEIQYRFNYSQFAVDQMKE